MSKRTLGIVLMVVGLVMVIVSLGADAIGLGAEPGLGLKQALGAVAGVIILAAGAWFWPGFPQSRMSTDFADTHSVVAAKRQRVSAVTKKAQVSKKARGSGRARKSAKRRK
jgi:cytochrome c biogenesis protein CcdA